MEYKLLVCHKGEPWENSWHRLLLSKDECESLFISGNQMCLGWRRDGGQWRRANSDYYEVFRPEIDQWLRSHIGHRDGEVWECDRFYHEFETLPELPKGGRGAWKKCFRCYPDEAGSHYDHAPWYSQKVNDMQNPKARAVVGFRDIEHARMFAALWL